MSSIGIGNLKHRIRGIRVQLGDGVYSHFPKCAAIFVLKRCSDVIFCIFLIFFFQKWLLASFSTFSKKVSENHS